MADNDSRAGERYASQPIINFVDDLHAAHDEALSVAFSAPEREGMPSIQLAKAEARFLEFMTRMTAATRVVEVGTLAGYSAIRLARGMPPGGRLWTLECEPHHAQVARENLRQAGLDECVTVMLGDALETLSKLAAEGPFDVVFVDADKERYPEYGRWAAANLRPGGLLIADNVYFFGKLLFDGPAAAAMRVFHQQASVDFDTCCLPTPDGLLLGVRRP